MNLIPDQPANCPTCDTRFEGPFCYVCGEKQTSRKDYTLKKYVVQAVDMFTHFDGKFFRTIKYLLFYPGKLTKENLAGRKVKLMKPVQLFVLISLVYFFLMKEADVFISYLEYASTSGSLYKAAQQKAAEKNIPFEEFKEHYDHALPAISKTFVFVLVPMIAAGVWLFFFRKSKLLVPHLIFATHFFTFFLLVTLIYFELVLLGFNPDRFTVNQRLTALGVGGIIVAVYLFFALKYVYQQHWFTTLLKTTALMVWFFLMLTIYRETVSWVYLYMI